MSFALSASSAPARSRWTRVASACAVLFGATACASPVAPDRVDAHSPHTTPSFIVGGTADIDDRWSAVGALVADRNGDGQFSWFEKFCTATLVSARRIVTAAHCFTRLPTGVPLVVMFGNDLTGDVRTVSVQSVVSDSRFDWNENRQEYDLAVIKVASSIETSGIPTMRLPTRALLSELRASGALSSASLFMIGYGADATLTGRRSYDYTDPRRAFASAPVMSLLPRAVSLLTNQRVEGNGGTCFGDSGGPVVLDIEGYRDVILGVATTGDVPCRSTSWYYRLDSDAAREFLSPLVSVP